MSKHTPGPWMAGSPVVYSDEDGEETIYQVTVYSPAPKEFGVAELVGFKAEIVPNARLIAAAPDLLEALEAIASGLANTNSIKGQWMTRIRKDEAWEIARSAIAKAKGEA